MNELKKAWQKAMQESLQKSSQETFKEINKESLQNISPNQPSNIFNNNIWDIHNIHSLHHVSKINTISNLNNLNIRSNANNIKIFNQINDLKNFQPIIRECKDICTKEEIYQMNLEHSLYFQYDMNLREQIAFLESKKHTFTKNQFKKILDSIWSTINEAKSLNIHIESDVSNRLLKLEHEYSTLKDSHNQSKVHKSHNKSHISDKNQHKGM